jgi:hypothetical protein
MGRHVDHPQLGRRQHHGHFGRVRKMAQQLGVARKAVRACWDFAAELLIRAAQTREESDIEMATGQRERTLRGEGWL